MRYHVHGPSAVARTAHVQSYRSPAARCLVEVYLPGWPCERYRLGMPEIDDTSATARLLVESFEIVDDVAARNIATEAASAAPTPPTMPRDDLGLPMWPSPPLLDPMSLARWHVSLKGLHWRVNNRLYTPSLARSLQSSLVLAIQAKESGDLVGCAELSLRPADGSLPGEFAPPAILLFAGSQKAPLTAYVSNLAVHAEHRRQRLATRLLAACEDIAAARWLCTDIYLHVSDQKCAAPPALRARP
jgi:GNAT superfamily N-acetyltransferase